MTDFSKIANNRQIVGGLILGIVAAFVAISKNLKFSELNNWQTTLIVLSFMAFLFFLTLKLLPLLSEKTPVKKQTKKDIQKAEQGNWKSKIFTWLLVAVMVFAFIFILLYHPSSNNVIIYEEEFNSNKYPNLWIEGEQEEAISKIESDYYNLVVMGNVPISRRINVLDNFSYSINTDTSNFEIELNLKKIEGVLEKNDGYGMELRGNKKNSRFYSFFINDNQEYAIQVYEYSSVKHDSVTWKISKSIKLNDFNTLKVKCIKNKFSFYINSQEVEKDIELAELGNEIGFGTAEGTAIQVDYLKLSMIEE
jgi:hypothetical protein